MSAETKVHSPAIYKHTKGSLALTSLGISFSAAAKEDNLEVEWAWRSIRKTVAKSRKKLHQIKLQLKDTTIQKQDIDTEPLLLFPDKAAMEKAQQDIQGFLKASASSSNAKRARKQQTLEAERMERDGQPETYTKSVSGPPPENVDAENAQYEEAMAKTGCLGCINCCCRLFIARNSS